jgi:DNA polymerase III alpha subunit
MTRRSPIASQRWPMNRPTMLANIDSFLKLARSAGRDRGTGQQGLFDTVSSSEPEIKVTELPDFSLAEKLWFERKTTGTYFAGHPTDLVRARCAHRITHKVREFPSLLDFGSVEPIVTLGMICKVFPKPALTVVEIEDETGRDEIIFSRERAQRFGFILWDDGRPAVDKLVLFKLNVRRGEYRSSMDVEQAHPMGAFTAPAL